jgi:hypothetical protein
MAQQLLREPLPTPVSERLLERVENPSNETVNSTQIATFHVNGSSSETVVRLLISES